MLNERYKAEVTNSDGTAIYCYTESRRAGKEFVKARRGPKAICLAVVKLCKPCKGVGVTFGAGFNLKRRICKKCKGGKTAKRIVYLKKLEK
jgi:DnaJ-class molecular chaperone